MHEQESTIAALRYIPLGVGEHVAIIVDDNARYLTACSRLLRRRGFAPRLFRTFEDAVVGIEELTLLSPPEVILIDLILDGGRSGLHLREQFTSAFENRSAIALMSAYPSSDHTVIPKSEPNELEQFLVRAAVLSATSFLCSISEPVTAFVYQYRLSPQEARIVAHLYVGVTRGSLSRKLGLSENTVKSQIRLLLSRFGLCAVDDLVAYLLAFTYERARSRS